MYHYLTVATLKRGFDGWRGNSSDVLTIIVQWCLSLFNVTVIAPLVVIGTECQCGNSTSLWLTLLRYSGYLLVMSDLLYHSSVFTFVLFTPHNTHLNLNPVSETCSHTSAVLAMGKMYM